MRLGEAHILDAPVVVTLFQCGDRRTQMCQVLVVLRKDLPGMLDRGPGLLDRDQTLTRLGLQGFDFTLTGEDARVG